MCTSKTDVAADTANKSKQRCNNNKNNNNFTVKSTAHGVLDAAHAMKIFLTATTNARKLFVHINIRK